MDNGTIATRESGRPIKRMAIGQRVRLIDPARTAARFWDSERGVIVGTGGNPVAREWLDGIGTVRAISGKGKTSSRGEVYFGAERMWLDASALKSACREIPQA